MKRVLGQTTENAFANFTFEVLTNDEMKSIKGGVDRPKSRDKDVYDTLEE
ncbi:bacteriocin [Maribellus luteus]|uniref:Bacteriocin n=1 Tax=Maribellus luteus TaxID=2305463 RepID=A0A399SSG1_9BACT|nr:bacteriocin [Maribellus luteus]RIJ47006.1 bacteriocin [Maribellus luteus]